MSIRTKNIIYTTILVLSVFAVYKYRKATAPGEIPEPMMILGSTMGTTYNITYFDKKGRDFKTSVDSLLALINKSINNYDPDSEVSRFNREPASFTFQLPYLYPPLRVAHDVYEKSRGAFDPTVMPLVNAWGFGAGKTLTMSDAQVDSILQFVGFDKIDMNESGLRKSDPRVQLDFGGIGQGYGADVIADFLKSKGIMNALVELGGEGMACGFNLQSGKPWRLGILDPNSTHDNQFFKAYVALKDKSFTTSGSYFNYREVDGRKFSHTIDPFTGFPAQRALLSASVFTDDATTADAWGTAFMVMGHEKAIAFLKTHPEIDALLMYSADDGSIVTYATPGIEQFLSINP